MQPKMNNTDIVFQRSRKHTYSVVIFCIGLSIFIPLMIVVPNGINKFTLLFVFLLSPVIILSLLIGRKVWSLKDHSLILKDSGLLVQGAYKDLIPWHEIEYVKFHIVLKPRYILEIMVDSKKIEIVLDMYENPKDVADTIITYWNKIKNA